MVQRGSVVTAAFHPAAASEYSHATPPEPQTFLTPPILWLDYPICLYNKQQQFVIGYLI